MDEYELYKELANAIVMVALLDYKKAEKVLRKNPNCENAKRKKEDVESFVKSQFFKTIYCN